TWRPPLPARGSPADLNYDNLYAQWEEITWAAAYQYGRATYGDDQVQIDRALLDGSLDILAQVPGVWLAVVAHGLARSILYATAVRMASVLPLCLFAVALPMAMLVRLAVGRPRPLADSAARRGGELLQLIGVPAVVLFVGETLLLVSVAMPYPRFLDPASVLLPAVVMTALYLVAASCCEVPLKFRRQPTMLPFQ